MTSSLTFFSFLSRGGLLPLGLPAILRLKNELDFAGASEDEEIVRVLVKPGLGLTYECPWTTRWKL